MGCGSTKNTPTIKKCQILFWYFKQGQLNAIDLIDKKTVYTNTNILSFVPKLCSIINFNNTAYIFGGMSEETYSAACYSATLLKESQLAELNEPKHFYSYAIYQASIVISGGKNQNGVLASCSFFDATKSIWCELPQLNQPKYSAVSCSFKGAVYIIGGCNTNGIETQVIEKLNMGHAVPQEWVIIAIDLSAVKLERPLLYTHENMIYIICVGGSYTYKVDEKAIVKDKPLEEYKGWEVCLSHSNSLYSLNLGQIYKIAWNHQLQIDNMCI